MSSDFSSSISRFLSECAFAISAARGNKVDRPFTVLVEGNTGSGKTTFLEQFQDLKDVTLAEEPVSKWQNCSGNNLVALMFSDPARWSMNFQSYVQLTMLENHLLLPSSTSSIKLMERSIFSARYCFVENFHRSGVMHASEYSVLTEWFDFLISSHLASSLQADLVLYLRTQPEVALQRVRQRSRREENKITLEYLSEIHRRHEEWLIEEKFPLPAPVIVVDANEDLDGIKMQFLSHKERIVADLLRASDEKETESRDIENSNHMLVVTGEKRLAPDEEQVRASFKRVILTALNK